LPRNLSINYVEFPASSFDEVKRFYGAAFAWTFTEYGQDYLAFNDGGFDGGFYRSDLVATTSIGAPLVILYAEDLEACKARVLDAGGKLSADIFSFPGGRRFQFTDPHGNELAVWSDK
jgi:hypothetical protein